MTGAALGFVVMLVIYFLFLRVSVQGDSSKLDCGKDKDGNAIKPVPVWGCPPAAAS